MDKPAFLNQGEGRNLMSIPLGGPDIGPEQQSDSIHDAAPAGLVFGGDLPVTSVPGGTPFTTNGFAPDPSQDKLPTPGSTEGNQLPPSGVRR